MASSQTVSYTHLDTAKELITRSRAKGKQVVTANKALLAEEGESLFRLADEKGATLLYEASVAGGIPIVQTLKESLTGNHITSLEGILHGTGNYILSEMTSKGVNFAPALAEAQEKGYAEADPTLDIDGFDTAHKLCLLYTSISETSTSNGAFLNSMPRAAQ